MSETTKSAKSLKYFMKERKDEIVSFPAPEGFTDDNGNLLELDVRVLSQAEISQINKNYRTRKVATNKNGSPLLATNNTVAMMEDRDNERATRHIMAAALVYPKLDDPELMKHFNCVDISEMPLHVFPNSKQYNYVLRNVLQILGLREVEAEDEDNMPSGKDVDDAKN